MYKKRILFAGNPNVGKSTIFNTLTGSKQHTGNWAGKTVEMSAGKYKYKDELYEVYDLPGTYSLVTSSLEEEVAIKSIVEKDVDVCKKELVHHAKRPRQVTVKFPFHDIIPHEPSLDEKDHRQGMGDHGNPI